MAAGAWPPVDSGAVAAATAVPAPSLAAPMTLPNSCRNSLPAVRLSAQSPLVVSTSPGAMERVTRYSPGSSPRRHSGSETPSLM